jgi:hypothetical protein
LLGLLTTLDSFLTKVWWPNRDRYREEAAGLEVAAGEGTGRVLTASTEQAAAVAEASGPVAATLRTCLRRMPGSAFPRGGRGRDPGR